MRTLASYVKKYGKVEGTKMSLRLQREAAHSSNHARHKKKQKQLAKHRAWRLEYSAGVGGRADTPAQT
jgi:hypothetical protein